VPLVNLTDLVLIGPGSEWFWTAVSGIVLAATFIAIYRQLSMQRADQRRAQLQELGDRAGTARMHHVKLRLALALKRGDDPDTDGLAAEVADFFDSVGYLHRRGYLSTDAVAGTGNGLLVDAVRWWTLLEPIIKRAQADYGPGEMADFERLAAAGRRWMSEEGFPEFPTDPASIAGRLDWLIDGYSRRLRLEQEIGAGVVPVLPQADPTVG
jgi:hypothetical protein